MNYAREEESVDGLFRNKVRVIQAVKGYRVSEDAVILTWFTQPKQGEVILDAGTGCGSIAFGLVLKQPSVSVIGLEIQAGLADRAQRGVKLNGLEKQVALVRGDLRAADRFFRHGIFDAVVCNPPYYEPGRGRINLENEKALSRHQLMMPLEKLFSVSGYLLKSGGRLSLIYPCSGINSMNRAMKVTGFKPTRVLWIHAHDGAAPGHVCIESQRGPSDIIPVEGRLYLYEGLNKRTSAAQAILAGEDFESPV